jgi:hypothetical protein
MPSIDQRDKEDDQERRQAEKDEHTKVLCRDRALWKICRRVRFLLEPVDAPFGWEKTTGRQDDFDCWHERIARDGLPGTLIDSR